MRKPTPARPIAETPVAKTIRSMLAKVDARHAEIARLLRAVQAAQA